MDTEIAATCFGLNVPVSAFLNDKRIERLNAGRYEGQEIKGALHVIREGDNVLELGAGIGVVGATAALNNKPAQVISFEANPNLIPVINQLYTANGLSHLISVRNQVLASDPAAPETMTFYVHNSYLGSSLGGDPRRAKEVVDVPVCRWKELMVELKPDVILMDIEGGELAILEHADLSSVRAIVIEFHPGAYGVEGMRKCKSILRDAGFERNDTLSSRTVWVAEKG